MATTQVMNRFKIGRILGIMAIAFFLMIGFSTNYIKAEEGEKKVTILHTNDIHAQIDDFAKLAAYKQKAEEESDIFFYVDAGDIFSGNPVVDMNDGEPIVELLNLVGLDLIGVGNHEYDYGVEALNKRIEQAEFPFLSANTEVKNSEYKQPEPFWTTEKDGVTFGFIALTQAPPATAPKNIEGIEFHSYKETIEQYADELKDVDVLIGVNHIGLNEDRKLAEELDIFDAIIGGHSHTEMKKEEVINDTTIVQTGSHLNNVGNMTITLDADNNVESIDWTLQPIEELTEKDEKVQEKIDMYNDQMEEQLSQEIGQTIALNRGARYERDTSLGNFWTDALRRVVDDSDIAVTNNGGIRADIPAGTLTYGDIYNIEPFGNEVMVIEMTGEAILDVLEYSFTRDGRNQIDLQTSGLEYVIHLNDFGELEEVEATVAGQPIDENETYTVVVPDYIGTGGSGYDFKGEVITGKAGLMTEAMIDYSKYLVETEGKIEVYAEERIKINQDKIDKRSISEAINENEGKAIVTGYVVGKLDVDETVILLADDKDEQDATKMLAVEIPDECEQEFSEEMLVSFAGTLGMYEGQPGLTSVTGLKVLQLQQVSAAKELNNDSEVTVEGVALTNSGPWGDKGFYVHDGTGGIFVYQDEFDVNEGDFVRVTGKKAEYNGEIQISSVFSIDTLGTNKDLPEIKTVTLDEIDASLVGELVKVENVTIEELEEKEYGTFEFTAKGNEDPSIIFRVDNRTGLSFEEFTFSKEDTVEVIGIVGQYNDNIQVKPRKPEDIVASIEDDTEEPSGSDEDDQDSDEESNGESGDKNPGEGGSNDSGKENDDKAEHTTPGDGNDIIHEEGSELPETATNTWNILLIGGVLIILGGGLLFVIQRKTRMNH